MITSIQPLHKPIGLAMDATMSPGDTSNSGASTDSTEVAILPKRTRVVVTGNNRTKRTLIGQEAVVKKAIGLGGWHWLVLANGEEVKLQRNALSVLEYGPDDQQESSSDEMTEAREPQIEILTRPRIRRPPRALTPITDGIIKEGITSHIRNAPCSSLVNLHKLDTVSLKRYRRVFKLPEADPVAPEDELVFAVKRHFTSQVVEESQVLPDFIAALRRRYKQQQVMMQQYPSHFGHLQQLQLQQSQAQSTTHAVAQPASQAAPMPAGQTQSVLQPVTQTQSVVLPAVQTVVEPSTRPVPQLFLPAAPLQQQQQV